MKIFNWNCNGYFKEDLPCIVNKSSEIHVDADIYVIQECENPDDPEFEEYRNYIIKHIGDNYFWTGDLPDRGLGIFAKDGITLEKIKTKGNFKHFLALRVEDSFNLLGVWAMDEDKKLGLSPYVEMIHDFFDANKDLFDENLIMCGDFNSSAVFNERHTYKYAHKDKYGKSKHHDNLNCKLNCKGLYSVYHKLTGEKSGEETQFTFFQARHLNKPFHLDYVYANGKLIDKTVLREFGKSYDKDLLYCFRILDFRKWIELSDHLPLVFKFDKFL